MKYSVAFVLFISTLAYSYAQRPRFTPMQQEIGIQVASWSQIPEISDLYTPGIEQQLQFANAIRYKYHLSLEDGIRVRLGQTKADFSAPEGVDRFSSYDATQSDFTVSVGYERKFHSGPFQLFAGADLIAGRGNIDDAGTLTANNDLITNKSFYGKIGANATAGIRTFLSKQLSFTLEGMLFAHRINPQSGPENSFFLLPDQATGYEANVYISYHFIKLRKRCKCPALR